MDVKVTEKQHPPACSNAISSDLVPPIFLVECLHQFKVKPQANVNCHTDSSSDPT